MKRLFVLMMVALCCFSASAVPAYPGLISYTQPDGSVIKIRLHGDEFCHWTTNEAGQLVEQDEDGYYRVVDSSKLAMRRSAGRALRAEANEARRGPAKASIATGDKNYLVILVQFTEFKFSFGNAQMSEEEKNALARQAFSDLLNKTDYNVNGGTGSARDFYMDNSGGTFRPHFDVYGPVTLSHEQAYYGGNTSGQGTDQRPREAVIEACQALNNEVNFAQYDSDDSDTDVDLVFMYYAGRGEADGGGTNCIWPHQWSVTGVNNNFRLDGVRITSYACTNELTKRDDESLVLCGIGTACHEFGHAMGLPDMYDTDYDTNGKSGGLYWYSTMASGSYNNQGRTPPYFNIEERIILGWQEESVIQEITTPGEYSLTSVNNNVAYKSATDMDGEYYLYECRTNEGWDAYIPQAGLIVYHVDKSSRLVSVYNNNNVLVNETAHDLWYSWSTKYNAINESGTHPCFILLPSADPTNLNYSLSGYWNVAFPGRNSAYTSFTGTSWNGVESLVQLTDIAFNGTQATFTVPPAALRNWTIANPLNGSYSAGSNFILALTGPSQPSSVAWYFDDEPVSGETVPLTAGAHVIEAHFTVGSEEKIVELTLTAQ